MIKATKKITYLRNTVLLIFFIGIFYILPTEVRSQYGSSCSDQYGLGSYEDYTGYCKCMSGYVFGEDFMGKTACVSGNTVCHDKYGYGSSYDSLSGSCECSYGYVFGKDILGKTSCISETQACKNQYGYNAQSSYGGKCECSYGHVISNGSCTDGNIVCHAKHGLYSSYDSLSNSCECDNNYTFDDSNQCVKKQNNVYFTLKEIDTDERRAIIKSDYDYRYYLIKYNSGCYSSSFKGYLNHQIVVNLGTDFDLDTWDKIVLQDNNETCDITRVERADSSTTLHLEEEIDSVDTYYVPTSLPTKTVPASVTPTQTSTAKPPVSVTPVDFYVPISDIKTVEKSGVLATSASFRKCPSTQCSLIRHYAEGSKVKISGEYLKGEWYRVDGTTDTDGTGLPVSGWIHKSLFNKVEGVVTTETKSESESLIDTTSTTTLDIQKTNKTSWVKKVWKFIWRF